MAKEGDTMEEFLTDIKTLRDQALETIAKGPVTEAYGQDLDRIIYVLNQILATELDFVLRYKRHYFTAEELNAQSVAEEFLLHAGEESDHADMISARIQQLGGVPVTYPGTAAGRGRWGCDSSAEFESMIREDLVAERVAITTYAEIIAWLGSADPASKRMLEEILETEEEHAEDMLDLLAGIG